MYVRMIAVVLTTASAFCAMSGTLYAPTTIAASAHGPRLNVIGQDGDTMHLAVSYVCNNVDVVQTKAVLGKLPPPGVSGHFEFRDEYGAFENTTDSAGSWSYTSNRHFHIGKLVCANYWLRDRPGHWTKFGGTTCLS